MQANKCVNTVRVAHSTRNPLRELLACYARRWVSHKVRDVTRTVLVLASFPVVNSALASDLICKYHGNEISVEQFQRCHDLVVGSAGAKVLREKDRIVVFVSKTNWTYVITLPDHPAYPAIVWRAASFEDHQVSAELDGYFAGDEDQFVEWLVGFGFMGHKMPSPEGNPIK